MESTSIAAAMAAKSQAETQSALAAEMMKIKAEQDQNMVGMLEASAAQMQEVAAAPPPGAGGNVDVFA